MLTLLLVLALCPAGRVGAGHLSADDQNHNGIPDVCRGGPYTVRFLDIQAAATPGNLLYRYELTGDSMAIKKVARIVLVLNRWVLPSNVVAQHKSTFGAGDTATKAAIFDLNAFTVAIPVQPGTALKIPFPLETTELSPSVGLISIGVDTGQGYVLCVSRTEDPAGPMGIEGPAVSAPIDTNAVTAAATVFSSPANNCPVEVFRDPAGNVILVRFAEGADANCTLRQVQLSEVTVDGVPVEFIGVDGTGGGGLVIIGSTHACYRLFDQRTGTVYLISTTGTSVDGCKT
jgi:hypothetical protein